MTDWTAIIIIFGGLFAPTIAWSIGYIAWAIGYVIKRMVDDD